jgi:hypothetical protein
MLSPPSFGILISAFKISRISFYPPPLTLFLSLGLTLRRPATLLPYLDPIVWLEKTTTVETLLYLNIGFISHR